MEVGLSTGDIVLDQDPAPPPLPPKIRWTMSVVVPKRLDGSRCHLVRSRPRLGPHCVRWGLAPPKGGGDSRPQFSVHVYCGQTVAHLSYC